MLHFVQTLILKGTVADDIPGGSSVDINFLELDPCVGGGESAVSAAVLHAETKHLSQA